MAHFVYFLCFAILQSDDMSTSNNNCNTCKAYNWECNHSNGGADCNRGISDPRKRAATLRRKEEEGSPAKRHKGVQAGAATSKNARADPTVLFHMMDFWMKEAEAWKTIARKNEVDNVKKDMEIQVLEAVNERHLQDIQSTMEVNAALWQRVDQQYATLVAIGRQFPEVAEVYMPYMAANTQPNSPGFVDLTADEDELL